MLDNVIDLSHLNPVSDFSQILHSGIGGILHKATQGSAFTDPTYAMRSSAARNAELLWGTYHFGDGTDVPTQVRHFLSVATNTPLLALDVEENPAGSSMSLAQAEEFVTQIFDSTGRWPGLYCGGYLKEKLAGVSTTVLSNCWLWYAEYGVAQPAIPPQWPLWTLWQYTDEGVVSGITGHCDRNRFNGSIDRLTTLFDQSTS